MANLPYKRFNLPYNTDPQFFCKLSALKLLRYKKDDANGIVCNKQYSALEFGWFAIFRDAGY